MKVLDVSAAMQCMPKDIMCVWGGGEANPMTDFYLFTFLSLLFRLAVVLVSERKTEEKLFIDPFFLDLFLGGPAREIAHFTGAHITGLNNNAYQVERAFHYAAKEGLQNQTNFIKVSQVCVPCGWEEF